MPILSGPMTIRRFTLSSKGPDDGAKLDTSPDAITAALQEGAFNMDAAGRLKAGDKISGWVHGDDGAEANFDTNGRPWHHACYAVFALRTDELKIPRGPLRIELKKRMKAWCEESGRERVPNSVKRELRELVEYDLAQKTLPTTKLCWVLWNTQDKDGYVIFHSLAQSSNDLFQLSWRHTFGVPLEPVNAATLAATFNPTLAALIEEAWMVGEGADDGTFSDSFTLSREFYCWLWRTTSTQNLHYIDDEIQGGKLAGAEVDAWLHEQMQLERYDGSDAKTTLRGDPIQKEEVRVAFAEQKGIVGIGMALRKSDLEFSVTLSGDKLDAKTLKLPPSSGEDDEARLYERIYLYEAYHDTLTKLFELFLRHRLDTPRWTRWKSQLKAWIQTTPAWGWAGGASSGAGAAGRVVDVAARLSAPPPYSETPE